MENGEEGIHNGRAGEEEETSAHGRNWTMVSWDLWWKWAGRSVCEGSFERHQLLFPCLPKELVLKTCWSQVWGPQDPLQ